MNRRGMLGRIGIAALLTLCAGVTAGNEFSGCGGGERPAGGELPTTAEVDGCLVDRDCVSEDMCVAVACVMRECVEVGVAGDEDGDGFAIAPCGMDCADADASRFPGATEICDGVDQDCDGAIDEEAVGVVSDVVGEGLTHALVVDGGESGFLVLGIEPGAGEARLVGIAVSDDGTIGAPTTVFTGLDPDVRDLAVDARGADLRVVVAAGTGLPRRAVIGRDLTVIEAPADLGADGDAVALDVLRLSGTEHVLLDTSDGRRVLVRAGLPTLTLTPSAAPPALASTGTLVAVTEAAGTIRFLDPVSGDDAGQQSLPGAFSARGLADGAGLVYAAYRDTFDHVIVEVRPTEVGAGVSAPAGARDDALELFAVPPNVAVSRRGAAGVSLALLSEDIASYVATFPVGTVSALGEPAVGASAATSMGGVGAVLFDHGGRSALTRLVCAP